MSEQNLEEILVENENLRLRLGEAEETLRAINNSEPKRKQGEANLLRMNRLYSVLSQTNQAIVRAVERESLFEEICRIAVEQGGLLMAWIGLVDEDTGLVRPTVWYGKNEGYLDNIRISVFEEPEGMGPSGRAIREADVCLTSDFLTDPSVLPWRENALKRGFRSSAAISLKQSGSVIGVLTFYSGEGDFFDDQFAGLLREIGADISFSLDSLYKEQERKRARQALHAETLERLRLSEELREKEKVLILKSRQAAMGETIEYVAHQWKQPLNALSIYAQLMKKAFLDGTSSGVYLERMTGNIMEQVEAMTRTIGDFRNFIKPEGEARQFSLREALDGTLALIGDSLKASGITVETVEREDPRVTGYRNEYSQVLVNILTNAKDVLIERNISCPRIDIRLFREGRTSVAMISDNAGGIPSTIIDRIFEPYFTTKESSDGTGIGLYLAKIIIEKRMNGKIRVQNTEAGAEFRIEVSGLPLF
jgi:signal transduction histidine kinase